MNIDKECTDVNLVVRQYDASLSSLLDKHAPSKRIYVVERPMNDWMRDDILVLKALCRKYESIWRKTRLTVHFDMYSGSCMDVKTAIVNIRSLKNKTTSLFDFIVSHNLDVLALTETWLCNDDNIILNELLPPSYDIRHVDRGRRGGGVALIYKKDISFRNIVTTNEITQFELLDCIIKVNRLSTRVVVVYRPPPSCKNGLRYEDFTVEWASYIEQFVEVQEELLIVGDFNIHVDSSNNESQSFIDILNDNGLIQHVKSSTHQKGHILDLVITREHSNLLKRLPVVFISGVSDVKSSSSLDHFAVLRYLNVNRPKTIHKSVKF